MKSVLVSLYPFEFPLKEKISVGSQTLDRRRVGLLKIQEGNSVGFGEASPLPGLSRETFDDVTSLKNFDEIPSLNWANQAARWNFGDRPGREVKLCGLILGGETDFCDQVVTLEENGFEVVKLKVGGDLKKDLAKVQTILGKTRKIKLRLDFNLRVNFSDLLDFSLRVKNLETSRIDYFEDPLDFSDPNQVKVFKEKTGFELAADKRLSFFHATFSENLVVKPMTLGLGGVNSLKAPRGFVVSSSFESNLGIFGAGQGVFEWGQQEKVHGLDTAKYFGENLFELDIKEGRLSLPSDREVRENLLKLTASLKPLRVREFAS